MRKKYIILIALILVFSKLIALDMISIHSGWFYMGDNKTELSPKHKVYVSSFEISPYEVTYGQFCDFILEKAELLDDYDKGLIEDNVCADELGYYPPKFHYNKQWPMIRISFYTALIFCNWLSEMHQVLVFNG